MSAAFRSSAPALIVFVVVDILFVVRAQEHMCREHKKSFASHTCVSSGQLLLWCCDYKEDMETQATLGTVQASQLFSSVQLSTLQLGLYQPVMCNQPLMTP